MKTIDRKNLQKEGASNKDVNRLLVEDPKGHHLLGRSTLSKNSKYISDLILLKRANDNKNKSTSLLISSISLCLSMLFVIGMFEWKTKENGSTVNLELKAQNFDDLLDIPQTEQITKPPVKAQVPVIVEVDDEEIIEEIEINLDIEMTEDTRIEQVIVSQAIDILPEEKVDEIFTIVEEQPTPVGGMRSFYEFVSNKLKYPPQARRMGIEGRVFVEFVVEKDGSLTDIKVVKGIGAGCDEEAVKVISEAPNWVPGKQRGRAVRVRMIMPIMFKLMA